MIDYNAIGSIRWEGNTPCVKLDGFSDKLFPHGMKLSSLLANGDANTKTRKNSGRGFLSAGLSLSPHKSLGVGNVCPNASPGCVDGCLAGQGLASIFANISYARRSKTLLYFQWRQWFLGKLSADIGRYARKADESDMRLCVRLNMFSDIDFERFGIPQSFPDVMFYDYTKHPTRAGLVCPNYWVTFSRSENNETDALRILRQGNNVAVVFYNEGAFAGTFTANRSGLQQLPKTWRGYPVVDGDKTDMRFDDPRGRTRGRVIGLRLKAHSNESRQKMIDSGFAVRVD